MKFLFKNEYFLSLWLFPPCLRGSEDLLPSWEGVRVDTLFSMWHVIWTRITLVSLVKTLVGRTMDWISIWDWYSLRFRTLIKTNFHKSSTLIQDKNSLEDYHFLVLSIVTGGLGNGPMRTYLVNTRVGYVLREAVVSKFMPPNIVLWSNGEIEIVSQGLAILTMLAMMM